ncbi:Rne/Rng family ribonuclease [Rhodobacter sp. NSM]|uniref:Rne/Rng family ribonuclease n=1 Tax=Rhodobacter sp. NSM TaxID=3457501 RepID=UPI003FD31726
MAKKMLIDATHPEETRVVVVDGNKVEEFDFETVNKRQLAGNIYLAKVTRVEPSLQAAFVDYGGNRHGFLAFAEIHPDYYQIPVADRKALLEEERAYNRADEDEDHGRSRRRPRPASAEAESADAVQAGDVSGMDVVDLGEETGADALYETGRSASGQSDGQEAEEGDAPYQAMDHASETDDEIESVADEDVAEEIPAPRKPRSRRYKIQEVIKVRQIMLVQVVKEERGNKGAALTTYLSLAGRYCVLMPNTARGGGISRKITQAADRKKLKEIASELEVPEGAGLIIRTAGAKRTKQEIRRDYEYLLRLWEQIRELTLKSIAPAPIYEEGDLIKRTIRDLFNREIEEVLVEGETGYRTAKDFMRMIMPAHARQVIRYDEPMPLFARYQVESYLSGMFNPVVQLKSGGYIVIGVTEALVAIDVNSGRATKEGSIEDTALKTNLEAAEEVARQLRLRDLAGLIVIDFIDMEERKNNAAVEKRLKDKLKTDRARIQVGRISGFGLMEMSRQRLRPGMLESTTQPCAHCHGTGLIRSDDSLALQVLRQLEEEGTRKRSKEVLLRAPIAVVNFLMNQKREHIAMIEARYGMAVRIEADPTLSSPDYVIEKFKTATRVVPETVKVISGSAEFMGAPVDEPEDDWVEEETEVEEAEEAAPEAAEAASEGQPKKKRRRRRRRRNGAAEANGQGAADAAENGDDSDESDDDEDEGADEAEGAEAVAALPELAPAAVVAEEQPAEPEAAPAEEQPTPRKRTRSRKPKAAEEPAAEAPEAAASPEPKEPKKPSRSRSRTRKAEPVAEEAAPAVEAVVTVDETPAEAALETAAAPEAAPEPAAEPEAAPEPAAEPEAASEQPAEPEAAREPEPIPAEADESEENKPKRRGWWSIGR